MIALPSKEGMLLFLIELLKKAIEHQPSKVMEDYYKNKENLH